jgi:hypothetical protein
MNVCLPSYDFGMRTRCVQAAGDRDIPDSAFDVTRLTPGEQAAWNDLVARFGASHAAGDFEQVIQWVRFLRARSRDDAAIRNEVESWTLDGISQIYVDGEARTMPVALVRAKVEQALSSQAENGRLL